MFVNKRHITPDPEVQMSSLATVRVPWTLLLGELLRHPKPTSRYTLHKADFLSGWNAEVHAAPKCTRRHIE